MALVDIFDLLTRWGINNRKKTKWPFWFYKSLWGFWFPQPKMGQSACTPFSVLSFVNANSKREWITSIKILCNIRILQCLSGNVHKWIIKLTHLLLHIVLVKKKVRHSSQTSQTTTQQTLVIRSQQVESHTTALFLQCVLDYILKYSLCIYKYKQKPLD